MEYHCWKEANRDVLQDDLESQFRHISRVISFAIPEKGGMPTPCEIRSLEAKSSVRRAIVQLGSSTRNLFQFLSLIKMTNDLNNHHHNEYRNEQNGQQHKAS